MLGEDIEWKDVIAWAEEKHTVRLSFTVEQTGGGIRVVQKKEKATYIQELMQKKVAIAQKDFSLARKFALVPKIELRFAAFEAAGARNSLLWQIIESGAGGAVQLTLWFNLAKV